MVQKCKRQKPLINYCKRGLSLLVFLPSLVPAQPRSLMVGRVPAASAAREPRELRSEPLRSPCSLPCRPRQGGLREPAVRTPLQTWFPEYGTCQVIFSCQDFLLHIYFWFMTFPLTEVKPFPFSKELGLYPLG